MHVENRSLNSEDMKVILQEVRKRAGSDMQLAIILDQASFHRSKEVLEFAAQPMIDIKLISNVVARPDLGTIGTFE